MKSKKRHHNSSDESEESDGSVQSSSSSDSDSDDSSVSETRYKKKRKRANNSSESESNSDDQKRSKKRKHKKKKKKHSKKKRRSDSLEDVTDDNISISEGEISVKKKRKHKHKHSKRSQTSGSEDELERHNERRLMSVVKERRGSSDEGSQPSRTYYQKEYHGSMHPRDYDIEQNSQKYYKEPMREHGYQDYQDYRERDDRYQDENRQREKYGHSSHNADYGGQREYNVYKRSSKYESRPDEVYRKERDDPYGPREDMRGHPKYPQRFDERPPKRFDDNRDYRDRRVQEAERYREKAYEKREKYGGDGNSVERGREMQRDRPARVGKPLHQREESRSRSPDEHYREKNRDRNDRYRGEDTRRGEERGEGRRVEERGEGRRVEERGEGRRGRNQQPRERRTRFDNANDNKEYTWGKTEVKKEGAKNPADKEKPNFGLSGKLTADANTVNGVVIKYTEPDDAKQPKRRWRFYPFKGDKALPILYIHRQSCFLIGRDKKVVDIALEHPSISKQHAALQYRATAFTRDDGTQGRRVRPYIIDLESANGTFVNNKKIEARRYVELLERDVVKFGFSAREYVLLHENSKDEGQDDDQEPAPALTTVDQLKREKHAKEAAAADGE
ncbi:smad nuclear-interacting protein 1 [Danaus plexippus]|uniref:smad nuclear-interacting protein 1 n=1 Tax=Danaus plexippus TaxID=13037 RepID=UPI002AB295A5|nr:smad nuclear-interacting protein 1 [Danaus plexippus]